MGFLQEFQTAVLHQEVTGKPQVPYLSFSPVGLIILTVETILTMFLEANKNRELVGIGNIWLLIRQIQAEKNLFKIIHL